MAEHTIDFDKALDDLRRLEREACAHIARRIGGQSTDLRDKIMAEKIAKEIERED